ncbi:CCA tRNA nucleotidyltransferase [Methanobrevibacter sp. OttesenSCG-928-K11]|nr:CCA tRNA nucleotidyltransferase [Methanobrevibacter sp. OttesenSCG-928-K11]MDL2270531.1 CCA tRNA nucleotidyltransferase [Methanobrevibacter sp. OttesenSCG-928-I08]
MNYDLILSKIKPTEEEVVQNKKIASEIIDFLNLICKEEKIPGEALLVGSVAKETFLTGKSDIDIFISFPLDTPTSYLKEKGLYLGYKASEKFNGKASEHYASHPYLTSEIEGFKIDFVPCYKIANSSQIKSAVDRTILHTKYITENISEKQKDEVILLKKFMSETKTYGSEYKVGGFAGYLCELLILKYNTFENLLKEVSNWKYGTVIDLESFGTSKLFKDPLITIDPTDKNRNVAAALRLETLSDFIISARNYLNSSDNEKTLYFDELNKNISLNEIKSQFIQRESKTFIINFKTPDVVSDSLHPQLKKTVDSISEKLEREEFSLFKSDYWTDEEEIAIFIFEMEVYRLNNIKIHYGPKIFAKKACEQFENAHGKDKCYPLNDFLVLNVERQFKTFNEFINFILTSENSHIIKIGKNIKDNLINSYELLDLDEYLNNYPINDNFINFLDDFLNPGQYLKR